MRGFRGTVPHYMLIYSTRGSRLHDVMVDAVLLYGGFLLIDDHLHEVLYAEHVPQIDSFRWLTRARPAAGQA